MTSTSAERMAAALEQTRKLPYRSFFRPNILSGFFSGMLAHHDLRSYAKSAVLPKMDLSPSLPPLPPPGHRSHANRLAIESELYRHLESMYNIEGFAQTVVEFSMINLPMERRGDSDYDADNGGGITVAASGFQINGFAPIGKPADVDRVLRWVMEYPLSTVNHMMHLVYPVLADWTIQEGKDEDYDKQLFRWARWGRDETTITEAEDTWAESVMIFVQPPWILTEADLEAFVRCPTFPPSNTRRKLKSNERLWGKIWDMCAQKHSRWFVLTTYWGWVFGCFSSGRTCAFTSRIIPFDSTEPTIVQCLFFWFNSALRPQLQPVGAWTIPEVPEPVDVFEDVSMPVHNGSVVMEESESSWHARSDARSHTPSAVDSDDEDANTVIYQLLPDAIANGRLPQDNEVIASWMGGVQAGEIPYAFFQGPPPPQSEASSGMSVTTVSSVSTVRELLGADQRHGAYMTGPVREVRLDYNYAGGASEASGSWT